MPERRNTYPMYIPGWHDNHMGLDRKCFLCDPDHVESIRKCQKPIELPQARRPRTICAVSEPHFGGVKIYA